MTDKMAKERLCQCCAISNCHILFCEHRLGVHLCLCVFVSSREVLSCLIIDKIKEILMNC